MKRMAFAAVLLVSGPVLAQSEQPCAPREYAGRMLTEIHGEQIVAQGLAESGEYVVEVFVNPETFKWTIIATLPTGMACLLEAGSDWRPVQTKAKKGKSA